MIRRRAARCLIILVALACCQAADADVTFVWLRDGRMLAGEIDPRTNPQRLWLRSSGTSFVLATSVAWENVEAANIDGRQVQPADLKKHVEDFPPQPAVPELPKPRTTDDGSITHLPRLVPQRRTASRVASIAVEARVANWDRDAAADGIEVQIWPRNAFGEIVPVSGQLIVELVARNQLPLENRDAFPQLGHWSLRVDADDFTHGAIYRLPYRSSHPATNLALEPDGLVKAKLFVFGQGRFEAEAPTRLRRFNPVRDDLQRSQSARDR